VLGPEHPDTLNSLSNVGATLYELGRVAESAEYLAEAAEAARRSLPEDSILAGAIFSNYGEVLTDLGRFAEAERELLEGRDILHRTLGPDHRLSLKATGRLEKLAEQRR
jgi:tetratricopeptide (TPR) repeat protein